MCRQYGSYLGVGSSYSDYSSAAHFIPPLTGVGSLETIQGWRVSILFSIEPHSLPVTACQPPHASTRPVLPAPDPCPALFVNFFNVRFHSWTISVLGVRSAVVFDHHAKSINMGTPNVLLRSYLTMYNYVLIMRP